MYGVIVSESSMNKYNIFADPLGFEIKNRRQGPKTAGYRRKPAAISNPGKCMGFTFLVTLVSFQKQFKGAAKSKRKDIGAVHYTVHTHLLTVV